MSFLVQTRASPHLLPVHELVGCTPSHVRSLAGCGAVQRTALAAGQTGEIVRLDHHVTFARSDTGLVSRYDGQAAQRQLVRAGTLHIRPAWMPHASIWDRPCELTVVSLEVRFLQECAADLFKRDLSTLSIRPMIAADDAFLWQLGARLDALVAQPDPVTVFMEQIFATMAMHLALTANAGPVSAPSRALAPAALRRVTAYIDSHLDQDIRLATLAALCHISVYHFSRQFSRETGIGVGRYIQLARMKRATTLLAERRLDIADVGAAVGYRDARAFARAYRQVYGLSPQAYRRLSA